MRLVKGAYWDYETVVAAQQGWPVPVFTQKWQSDANYEVCARLLMENNQWLRPAFGSHNVRSISSVLALADEFHVPPGRFEFQMLYGMAGELEDVLVAMGNRVRIYTPYGQLLPGMAYLVRRLLENTSNESFLRAGFHDHLPEDELLMNPITSLQRRLDLGGTRRKSSNLPRPDNQQMPPGPFTNEPLTDFSRATNRRAMESRRGRRKVSSSGEASSSSRVNQRAISSSCSSTLNWSPSAMAVKPSMMEEGKGQGWEEW